MVLNTKSSTQIACLFESYSCGNVEYWVFFQNQSVRRRKINYKRLKNDQEVEAEQRETETVQDQESNSEAQEENNLMEEIISYETSWGRIF